MTSSREPVVAIDFGTSTILVAVRTNEEDPDPTIPIGHANSWMPSVVGIDDQGAYLFGEDAERLNENQVIRSIKTLLGGGKERVLVNGQSLQIDQLIEKLLIEAVNRAKANAGNRRPYLESSFRVHLCCPANWTAKSRKRLGAIAKRAGLDASPDEIVDEPIAAGVSWVSGSEAFGRELPEGRTLVFDYGGGTLDVAVLEVARLNGAPRPDITVLHADALSSAGDRLDELIAKDLENRLTISGWSGAESETEKVQLTRRAARELKHLLSESDEAGTRIPGFDGPVTYTRKELEAAFDEQLVEAVRFALNVIKGSVARQMGARYQRIRQSEKEEQSREIDHILLAGGMSRIPYVRKKLRDQLGREPEVDPGLVDPEKSVVSGLTFHDAVTGLNVHRPGFSFLAQYLDANGKNILDANGKNIEEQVLYEAFSPLYDPGESFIRDSDLGTQTNLEVPNGAESVKIICQGISGRVVPLQIEGELESVIECPLSPHDRRRKSHSFKLFVDGRIVLHAKKTVSLWIPRWPILRDGMAAKLQAERKKPKIPWYGRAPDPIDITYNR